MILMPPSVSSSVETSSPMRSWLVRAGWRRRLTMLPMMSATTGRNSTEKRASSHEMAIIITV